MWKHWECLAIYLFILKMWFVHKDWRRVLLSGSTLKTRPWIELWYIYGPWARESWHEQRPGWLRKNRIHKNWQIRMLHQNCDPFQGCDSLMLPSPTKTSGIISPYTAGSSSRLSAFIYLPPPIQMQTSLFPSKVNREPEHSPRWLQKSKQAGCQVLLASFLCHFRS